MMFRVLAMVTMLLVGSVMSTEALARKTHTEKAINLAPREVAEEPASAIHHEVLINIYADVLYGTSSQLSLNGPGGTTFLISGGYNYTLPQVTWLQVGGFASLVTGSGITQFQIAAGPTVNYPFDWDIRNAFFLDGYAGVITASGLNTSATSFLFGFDVGKRFKIFENLVYRPSFGVSKGNGSMAINFNFVSFSALF